MSIDQYFKFKYRRTDTDTLQPLWQLNGQFENTLGDVHVMRFNIKPIDIDKQQLAA